MAELKMAQHALREAKTKTQSRLANDKIMGVYKEDLDMFGNLLCNKLSLKRPELRKKVRESLEQMSLAYESQLVTQAKIDEFHFDGDTFHFLYGFMVGRIRPGTNKLDIRYAIFRLMFSVQTNEAFSPEQVVAIKNHYGKNEALQALKQENAIAMITYV